MADKAYSLFKFVGIKCDNFQFNYVRAGACQWEFLLGPIEEMGPFYLVAGKYRVPTDATGR